MAEPSGKSKECVAARARIGAPDEFCRQLEPHRRELIAYCYRLTGRLSEAEDLTQESFVRAYRSRHTFEGRGGLRAWLYAIAHNLCVNHVQRHTAWASLDRLPNGDGLATRADSETHRREDVRLSFVALLQSLPPRQRVALVLRDVLGWSAEETARIQETTVPSVKNALARARQTLARHPMGDGPEAVQDLAASDPEARALVAEWVDAFEKGNTPRMVALLTGSEASSSKTRVAEKSHSHPAGQRNKLDCHGYNIEETIAPAHEQEAFDREPKPDLGTREEEANAQR